MRPYSLSPSSRLLLSLAHQNPNLSPASSPFTGTSGGGFNLNTRRLSVNPNSHSNFRGLSVKCRQSDYFEPKKFSTSTAPNNNSSFAPQTTPRGWFFTIQLPSEVSVWLPREKFFPENIWLRLLFQLHLPAPFTLFFFFNFNLYAFIPTQKK